MRKFLLMMSFLALTLSVSATTAVFDLTAEFGEYAANWGSSYTSHTIDFTEATVDFSAANKQSGTITDCPVMKSGDVIVKMNEGYGSITKISVTIKQWTTKTVNFKVAGISYDGSEFVTVDDAPVAPAYSGGVSTLTYDNVPAGVVAVKFSNTSSNQMGVSNITVDYNASVVDNRESADISFSKAETTLNVEETETITLINPYGIAISEIEFTNADDNVATYDPETGIVEAKAVGTTTVTATFAGNDSYKPESTQLLIVVEDPNSPVATWVAKDAIDNPGNAGDWTESQIDGFTKWTATIGGTNNPKYYETGEGLRIYNGGTFTITSTRCIAKIELTFAGSPYTFSKDDTSNPLEVEPNKTSYSWDVSRTCRLQKIVVTYNLSAEAPAAPSINVPKGQTTDNRTFTIEVPAGCSVWYKIVAEETPEAAPARAEAENDGFEKYTEGTELSIVNGEQLMMYAEDDTTGMKSDVITKTYGDVVTTGVNAIDADNADAPVFFYNLQGVRVANPESGLFIRVQGDKATKVIL